MEELRKELINFLREERKLKNISFYCNDFEFADRLLKLINGINEPSQGTLSENKEVKEFYCLLREENLGVCKSQCQHCKDWGIE